MEHYAGLDVSVKDQCLHRRRRGLGGARGQGGKRAFINGRLQADMIDSAEFPQLTQRYQVAGVPLTSLMRGAPSKA
ncbi:MAG: hypothetical protein WAN51_14140, partial [Alphaproteobacteria bacterium]